MTNEPSKLTQNNFLSIILVTLFVTLLALLSIRSIQTDKEESFYKEKINALNIAYTSNINKYKLLTLWIFNEFINKQEILSLVNKGMQKGEKQRYYRGLLYQKLSKDYELLAKYNIRQLHFHTPDNHSFLRFHKPDKSGDSLAYMRPSIVATNSSKEPISIFETGRVVSGFRNIFPLHYEGKHIGSVEISATTEAILETLSNLDKSKNYRFILNKDIVYPKLFERQKRLYSPSYLHPNFIREDANKLLIKHTGYNYLFEEEVTGINKELANDKNLKKALERGLPYGTTLKYNNEYQTVILLPMQGVNKSLEGYLVSYAKEKNMPFILTKAWLLYTLVILGAISFILLIFLIKRRTDTITTQRAWFQSVINTLGEGLYVMNKEGLITYINDSACKILGYKKEELLGKQAHSVFHQHKVESDLYECPIYKTVIQKEFFYSEKEFFTKKSGKHFPVEVSSAPFMKEDRVNQIVSTFKDITETKKINDKMQMLTTALEASINAVVITDVKATIEWANPAFEKMTGYSIKEAIGKKPKELIASGKQSKEFYLKLWESILDKKPWKGELINKRKNGENYYEELSITPVLDDNKNITHFIAVKQDVTIRKNHEKNMELFAFYDILTNLPNRRLFMDRFETLLAQMRRQSFYSALLFLDLDKFKAINDTYGHESGDIVLQETATRLKSVIREHDTVARLGGDEFVVLVTHLNADAKKAYLDIQTVAEKICESIRSPFEVFEACHTISISVGAYLFNKEEDSINTLFKKADKALYEAKNRGKDTYYIATQNNKNKAN